MRILIHCLPLIHCQLRPVETYIKFFLCDGKFCSPYDHMDPGDKLMQPIYRAWICRAAVLSSLLLAGCAGVRLQSLDQTLRALSSSVQNDAKQECQKSGGATEYLACTRQVDKTFDQFRQEQKKSDFSPMVIQPTVSASGDASASASFPK